MDASQDNTDDRWLRPSEALNRFDHLRETGSNDPSADESEAPVRYGFRVGNIGLLIASQTPSEVIAQLPIYPLPNTAPWFQGLGNLRGDLVPVYDLERLFGLQSNDQGERHLLILGKAEKTVGIIIRGLPQAQRLDDTHEMSNLPPLPEHLEGYVSKAYANNQEVWRDFEHEGFFKALVTQYHD